MNNRQNLCSLANHTPPLKEYCYSSSALFGP